MDPATGIDLQGNPFAQSQQWIDPQAFARVVQALMEQQKLPKSAQPVMLGPDLGVQSGEKLTDEQLKMILDALAEAEDASLLVK